MVQPKGLKSVVAKKYSDVDICCLEKGLYQPLIPGASPQKFQGNACELSLLFP